MVLGKEMELDPLSFSSEISCHDGTNFFSGPLERAKQLLIEGNDVGKQLDRDCVAAPAAYGWRCNCKVRVEVEHSVSAHP